MKHTVKLLALVLALMLIGGAALAEVVTTANVWLRSGPGLNYDQVTSYKEGKSLTFLGETQMDDRPVLWYKVSDGKNEKIYRLDRPYYGLHVPPGVWAEELNFSSGSICLVLTSHEFDESDYWRKYSDYLAFKRG